MTQSTRNMSGGNGTNIKESAYFLQMQGGNKVYVLYFFSHVVCRASPRERSHSSCSLSSVHVNRYVRYACTRGTPVLVFILMRPNSQSRVLYTSLSMAESQCPSARTLS